jgi:hypothetical protein
LLQVTTDVNGAKQPVNFRKLLVSRCQQEFERDYLHGLDKAKYEADLLEAGNDEIKRKTVQVIIFLHSRRPPLYLAVSYFIKVIVMTISYQKLTI